MEIKFFKTKKSFKKGGVNTNPEIYWIICLCLLFAVFLVSAIFGFYLYLRMNADLTIDVNSNNSPSQMIDEPKLKKVLNYFSDREKKSAQIINSPAPVVDPSL